MKSTKMEKFLEDFCQTNFRTSRKDNTCVVCSSPEVKYEDFKDALSRKEYEISRMCQKCQDKVFGDCE